MTEAEARSTGDGPRKRRTWLWVLLGVAVLLLLTAATIVIALLASSEGGTSVSGKRITWEESYVSGDGAEKIAVLPVSGLITGAQPGNPLATGQVATPEALRSQLDQASEDDRVRAVIVEVNSGGGEIVASDRMRAAITEFKEETGKPLVVSMQGAAASGGYWISLPADRIVAHPATVTGSIGVILPYTNYEEALDKLGIYQEPIKSGNFKDLGSPSNELTPEEREILQSYVDEGYDQFVRVVAEGRDLPEDEVREIGDGRIYTGLQAKELGLVDDLGSLEDAARIARDLARIDSASVVRYERSPGLFGSLQARIHPAEPEAMKILRSAGLDPTPELQAIWRPGM